MALKPQDVLVAVQTALLPPGRRFSFAEVGKAVAISRSEAHAAVGRCLQSKLLTRALHRVDSAVVPHRANLLEFLVHGVKYAFPPAEGGITRGVPTGYAAPALAGHFASTASTLPLVWPHPEGATRGRAFEPLYPSVPRAALGNPPLYAALSLLDAIRGGGARDRELGERLLGKLIDPESSP